YHRKSERILKPYCPPARWLSVTDLLILSYGQVTRMTSELAPSSPINHFTPIGKTRLSSSRQIGRSPAQPSSTLYLNSCDASPEPDTLTTTPRVRQSAYLRVAV
ncbi:hypothetical protein TNCV_2094671, partial [Trichonephila clavipes]